MTNPIGPNRRERLILDILQPLESRRVLRTCFRALFWVVVVLNPLAFLVDGDLDSLLRGIEWAFIFATMSALLNDPREH